MTARAPLYRWAPEHGTTFGDIAAKVGADLELVPDAEQQWLLDAIYAESAPEVPTSSEVVAVAPRQNIKSSTFEVAAMTDLFVVGVPLAVWTAHQFKTSRKAFEDMRRRILRNPDYASRCFFRDSHGEEAITLHTGETLEFHARSGGSGRGFSGVARITLDEALFLRPADMGALSPTQVTRDDAQIRYGSSAGLVTSEVLRGLRERGRAGNDPSLAYVEYAATYRPCDSPDCSHIIDTPGCVLDDRELWWQANCAMWAGRITEAAILKQRRRLTPAEFMREFFTWWEDPPGGGGALDINLWAAQADPSAGAPEGARIEYAVAVAPDRSWAAIGAAWKRPDGHTQVSLVDYKPTATWVDARIKELGGSKPLLDTAARGLVSGTEMTTQQQAQAHNALYDAVIARTVWHDDLPALNVSVRSSAWRSLGDTRVLDAKGGLDISPLRAVAHAAWAVNHKPTGGWMVSL